MRLKYYLNNPMKILEGFYVNQGIVIVLNDKNEAVVVIYKYL